MVYLLHFDRPFHHARHYLGYCNDSESLEQRIERHRAGDGAKLLRAVTAAGITFKVVRVWKKGSRKLERRLKAWKKSWQLCPICREERRRGVTS
jgi:hypothetical protein